LQLGAEPSYTFWRRGGGEERFSAVISLSTKGKPRKEGKKKKGGKERKSPRGAIATPSPVIDESEKGGGGIHPKIMGKKLEFITVCKHGYPKRGEGKKWERARGQQFQLKKTFENEGAIVPFG